VLVTRPADHAGETCALLDAAGSESLCVPTVSIAPLSDPRTLDDTLHRFESYDLVAFSSATAARVLCQRAGALGLSLLSPSSHHPLILAGPATAAVLAQHGLTATHVLPRFSADSALAALAHEPHEGKRALVPRAQEGRETLADGLRARGALVDELVLYRTVPVERSAALIEALRDPRLTAILLFSPSAVTGLHNALRATAQPVSLVGRLTVGCIGHTTGDAARAIGLHVDVVPPHTTARSLVHALAAHLSSSPTTAAPAAPALASVQ